MFFNIITRCAVEETIYCNQFYLNKDKIEFDYSTPFYNSLYFFHCFATTDYKTNVFVIRVLIFTEPFKAVFLEKGIH